jgi:prephenate dehydratase
MSPAADGARKTLRIAYLGPQGSFSELAVRSDPAFDSVEFSPASSIADAVREVVDGGADKAVVPIENAITGRIEATEQALARFPQIAVERELTVAVHLDLLAMEGTEIGAIRRLVSFSPATAQCRRFLQTRLPEVEIEEAASTAFAARRVADLASTDTGAIASARAGEVYGLATLARSIEDDPGNWTRFAVVGRSGS